MTEHQQSSAVYHLVAVEFAGRDRAKQVVDLVRRQGKKSTYKVAAWAVLEVDDRGKSHVTQSGRGGMGAGLGAGGGAVLGLIGGPAGLLAWALGGALIGGLAGKHFGQQFDPNALKAIGAGMQPNSSALVAIVEDKNMEQFVNEAGHPDATIITATIGSQLSGELAQVTAIGLGEEAEEATAELPETAETQE
jgi:uncharacterized membrane protein